MAPVITYLDSASMAATPPTTIHAATTIRHNSMGIPGSSVLFFLSYGAWIIGVENSVNAFLVMQGRGTQVHRSRQEMGNTGAVAGSALTTAKIRLHPARKWLRHILRDAGEVARDERRALLGEPGDPRTMQVVTK